MQTQPNRYSQMFMTAIGLGLLIMAMVLNHYHPHNEGIAVTTRGNIIRLNLNVAQAGLEKVANIAFAAKATASSRVDSAAISPDHQTSLPAVQVAAAVKTEVAQMPDVACMDLDNSLTKQAQKDIDLSYRNYQKDKKQANKSDDSADLAYATYKQSLADIYQTYEDSLAAQNCAPTMTKPVAEQP